MSRLFIGISVLNFSKYSLAIITILVIYCWWKNILNYISRRVKLLQFALSLPGPPALPLLGNALEFAVSAEDTLETVVKIARNNESIFRFWLGPKLIIVLRDPRDYAIILASSRAAYKDPIYDFLRPMLGTGLVSGSGPTHRAHRKIIAPMVNGKTLSIYLKYFNKHTHYCAQLLTRKINAEEFDILPFMTNCTSDMMFESIFGVAGTAQQGGYKQFVHYSDRIYELMHMRMVQVWLHPDFIFNRTKMGEEQRTGMNIIHGIIDNIIVRKKKEYLAVQRGVVDASELKVSVLDQLVEHAMKNKSLDDLELRHEIYTVYIAAQDTVAVIASFGLLMLAIHPEIQDKVRREIAQVFADDDDDVAEGHLSKLEYLNAVILETVRLFPIAPIMVRKTTGEIKLENCTLPEGCSIVMTAFMTQRDPKHWTDPEKFDPDRFLSGDNKERHSCSFVGFSGGSRACIAQKFATICLKTLLVNILRDFKFDTSMKLGDLKLKMDISIRSVNGYSVKISPVDKS